LSVSTLAAAGLLLWLPRYPRGWLTGQPAS